MARNPERKIKYTTKMSNTKLGEFPDEEQIEKDTTSV